jgi:outer membrane receptor protein involved in Fe transport
VTQGTGPGAFPLVGFVAAGGTYRVRRNLDAVRATGVEVDAAWRTGPIGIRASWSRIDARVSDSSALDRLRPAQVPGDQISATLDATRKGASAALTLRHVARQFDDDANTRMLAPATTLDGYLAAPLSRTLAVELRAENVLDERVEAGVSGADVIERATARTLWIGLRYRP